MMATKALLFDMGGVLVDFVGLQEIRKLMPEDPGPNAIRSRWISSSAMIDFESGKILAEEFGQRFIEDWSLDIGLQEFLRLFASWIQGAMTGAHALLEDLRPHFILACLSNTNALHWDEMLNGCGFGPRLDKHYASHLAGCIKPDPAIFEWVCDDLGCRPDEIVFFDDGVENVEGARRCGFVAQKVTSPAEIRKSLIELDLLRS